MFVGNGFDIHKHSKGENLILGGIRVDGDGFEAHSDGDIVLHSLCDALLGSKAKKDLAGLTTQGGGGGIASSGMTGAQAAGMGGGSRQATSAGSTKSGRTDGGWGWAKGGFVRGSYFNGGIVSLRRR